MEHAEAACAPWPAQCAADACGPDLGRPAGRQQRVVVPEVVHTSIGGLEVCRPPAQQPWQQRQPLAVPLQLCGEALTRWVDDKPAYPCPPWPLPLAPVCSTGSNAPGPHPPSPLHHGTAHLGQQLLGR